jgi:uncharacterized repeat protein (TIGR03803 family)
MKAVSIALFAGIVGCAFVQPVAAEQAAFKLKVLHSFGNGFDGQGPEASFSAKGLLYGTTYGGGFNGGGTAFTVDRKTGAETVLYSFDSKHGRGPSGGMIELKGRLYGTTQTGGNADLGTAFVLDPKTGKEKVLYSFCQLEDCADGQYPDAGLIDVSGTLYGTTHTGGNGNDSENGTAFALDPKTGTETVIYDFCSQENCADGEQPTGGLIDVNGLLYGATLSGGAYGCGNGQACGTVFSLDPESGVETVLHSFGNGTDGKYPESGVLAVNGMLYGTTYAGGITGCGPFGCGTAFSIDPATGTEKVLYSFCSQQNCADGASPFARMIDVNGTLYGTTQEGGGTGCNGSGCGTVFSIDPNTGTETVLYSYCSQKNCADGEVPSASLIDVNGTLYGTTGAGGAYGYGTVFVLEKNR